MSDEQDEGLGFVVSVGQRADASRPSPEILFRIAVLGDFSGRANRSIVEASDIADRLPFRVDRDNVDQAVARLAPKLRVPLEGERGNIAIDFSALYDFHPDSLHQRLPGFQQLRETRRLLADPSTFARLKRELQEVEEPAGQGTQTASATIPGELLEQIVAENASEAVRTSAVVSDDMGSYLKRIVAPHLISELDPVQSEWLQHVDGATGIFMRRLMHHPDFQSLEALWRSLDFLARRIETSSQLQLHLIDVSKAELSADQMLHNEPEESGLYRLLVESSVATHGGEPWAVLVGGYSFGPAPEDLHLLTRLAGIARQAGAAWISEAQPQLTGCDSFETTPDPASLEPERAPAWSAFRRTKDAASLGLVLPRILLRLPYGLDTEPCDTLEFEEMAEPPVHGDYLWGNPAFACALLLAESFQSAGWAFQPGAHLGIGHLPLHLYKVAGQAYAKPCAEALMTERVAARLLDQGLMPLASIKDSDAVKLVRMQSVAEPPGPLVGQRGG